MKAKGVKWRLEKISPQTEQKRTFPLPWPRAGRCSLAAEPRAHPYCHAQTNRTQKESWKREVELVERKRKRKKNRGTSLQGPSRKGKHPSATPSLPWLGKTNPAPPWETWGQVPPPRAVEQGSPQPPAPRGSSRAGRSLHPTAQQSKRLLLKSAKLQRCASAYAGGTSQARTRVQPREAGTGSVEGTAPMPLAQLGPPSSPLSWQATHRPRRGHLRLLANWLAAAAPFCLQLSLPHKCFKQKNILGSG